MQKERVQKLLWANKPNSYLHHYETEWQSADKCISLRGLQASAVISAACILLLVE